MRIRRHAQISPLFYTASSLNPALVTQTVVCQLNQSPWDVITFPPQDPATLPPPPPFLVDEDYYQSFMENKALVNHIVADESPKVEKWYDMLVAAGGVNIEKEGEEGSKLKKEEEEIILCSKTDRKGWQCGERVKTGHSLCENHLPKGKTHGNPANSNSKKPEENRRRPRPRKPRTSSNPHEFYYYSGFGPRWGKKRGSEAAAETTTAVAKPEPYSSSPESGSTGSHNNSNSDTSSTRKNTAGIIEEAADNEGPNASDSTTATTTTPPPPPEPNNFKAYSASFPEFANYHKEIDYVEDDEDDDEDDNVEIGKKRSRKPIKARSLKSLM